MKDMQGFNRLKGLAMSDPSFIYRPILELIGKAEGTDAGDGYNETFNYGAYTGGNVNLVGMTLDEIDWLQTSMLRHPANNMNSSACGRYQIVRTTLRDIRKRINLDERALFDEVMQDTCARFLLGRRGIDKYLMGNMPENDLINNLAREWASLPTVNGTGYYSGQHATVSVSEVRSVLAEIRERWESPGEPSDEPPQWLIDGLVDYIRQAWKMLGSENGER